MPLATWPSQAKIRRLDLALQYPKAPGGVSPLSGRQIAGASTRRALWVGEVELAANSRDDLQAISAWVEQLRGRSGYFALPLEAGFATFAEDNTGIGEITAGDAGDSTITVDNLDTSQTTLAAGTLLTVGEYTNNKAQLVEVASDAAVSTSFNINIQPPLRINVVSGFIHLASIYGRFRLREDADGAGTFGIGYGAIVLPIIEVPFIDDGFSQLLDDDGADLQDDDLAYLGDD